MKQDKKKRIGLILFAVVLAFAEFGLDMWRAERHNGWVFVLFVGLAVLGLFLDIRKVSKQAKGEEVPNKAADAATDATVGAMSLLDKGLRRINPDYDPDAVRKLDEMKQAGLIDEKEYQQRKKELAEK